MTDAVVVEDAVNTPSPPLPIPHRIDGFTRLDRIETQAATPSDVSVENVKHSLSLNLPRFHKLPEFMKIKGRDKKIALVGGGPSVKNYVDDIKQFKTVIACGSSNDWIMQQGIVPTYSAICDPDPVSIKYFQHTDTETKYLIASCCDPLIFKHLEGKQVILWHCDSEEQRPKIVEIDKDYHAIGGGCTVGLRCISMAIMMGYSNIHMFGFDSCLGVEDKHHAYNFQTETEELGHIYSIRLGDQTSYDPEGRVYRCAGYQLAQAEHFRQFYKLYHEYFIPTIYGDGLITGMMDLLNKEVEQLRLEQLKKSGVH